jgi:hypothetical protein
MSESSLRVKFGEHEFEAEGPAESVERQFLAFRLLIHPPPEVPVPAPEPMIPAEPPAEARAPEPPPPPPAEKKPAEPVLERIMKVDGPIVWLTVSTNLQDAILAILLGHRQLRRFQVVSGGQMIKGLRFSGFHIPRADVVLRKSVRQGTVVAMGRYRTLRYQLSLIGFERAQQIVRKLVDDLPPVSSTPES